MVKSKIINSDLMIDADRDDVNRESYFAKVPLTMTVQMDSEGEMEYGDVIERIEDLVSTLCERIYAIRDLSDITNITIDTNSKWDIEIR